MSLEQEIKLVVHQHDKIDLLSLINLDISKIEINHVVSTYYDTDDLYLSKQKLGLRLRQYNDAWWQTVKTAGSVKNGLHQRDEWEYPLQKPEWDLATLRQTPLQAIIDTSELWSKIQPIFVTDFIRQTVPILFEDGSQIEFAYDYGKVIAGDKECRIHEIELELKSGHVDSLNHLAGQLQNQLDISPSDCSKAKMGYQLLS